MGNCLSSKATKRTNKAMDTPVENMTDNSKNLNNKPFADTNTNRSNTSSLYISNQKPNDGNALFLIDVQHDFVHGSLKVPKADEDCKRTVAFLEKNGDKIDEVYCTLDTHMQYHIAHPMFWKQVVDGKKVDVIGDCTTVITHEDIKNGKYVPTINSAEMKEYVLDYTKQLEASSKFKLVIWPPHCLIGTKGHCIEKTVSDALAEWELNRGKTVHYIIKGNNSLTEHYSAFQAEVPLKTDPATQFNMQLYHDLAKHKKIYIAGQARSHCVNWTTRHLSEKLGQGQSVKKLVLLEDAMSDVATFESLGQEFWNYMLGIGDGNVKRAEAVKSDYVLP